ncbi:MAG: OpgC domain-containing protein [Thermoanaerobaculia bacterium]
MPGTPSSPGIHVAVRDDRLDLLRGLCLLKMFLTHLWPQPVDLQPLFGFVSAAEGFFLISGVTTGIVYRSRAAKLGIQAATSALLRRSVRLYLLNLALIFIFFAAETTHILPYSQLRPAGFSPFDLLSFNQPYFLQVLPRYALYLAFAPLVLVALRRGWTVLLLAISLLFWAAVQIFGRGLALPFVEHGPYGFLVLAWQLPFFGGMIAGFHRERLGEGWRALSSFSRLVLPALLFSGFVILGLAHFNGLLDRGGEGMARLFGREQLAPGRLIDLLCAAAFLFALTDRFLIPLRRFAGWLLLPFGRHALYIFLAHIATYGLCLILGPWLPFRLDGHPVRLAIADLLHFSLLWALARWTPLRRQLAL